MTILGHAGTRSDENGGVTGDGLCKQQVGGCALPAPVPANETQIGRGYGFTWGNGGAAVSSCPAGFAISGNNCVKSYPATAGTAAYCKR